MSIPTLINWDVTGPNSLLMGIDVSDCAQRWMSRSSATTLPRNGRIAFSSNLARAYMTKIFLEFEDLSCHLQKVIVPFGNRWTIIQYIDQYYFGPIARPCLVRWPLCPHPECTFSMNRHPQQPGPADLRRTSCVWHDTLIAFVYLQKRLSSSQGFTAETWIDCGLDACKRDATDAIHSIAMAFQALSLFESQQCELAYLQSIHRHIHGVVWRFRLHSWSDHAWCHASP